MSYLLYYKDHIGNECYLRKHETMDDALNNIYKLYLKMKSLDDEIVKLELTYQDNHYVKFELGNQRSLVIRKEGY